MDLNNAEVAVTTQHILDGKEYKDYWVQMSDYSDMGEFLCACSDLFPEEEEPEYRYTKWENIPDYLIRREWICPNFFVGRPPLLDVLLLILRFIRLLFFGMIHTLFT